jgi:hypothetical protein
LISCRRGSGHTGSPLPIMDITAVLEGGTGVRLLNLTTIF